jgi:hypothetical protein
MSVLGVCMGDRDGAEIDWIVDVKGREETFK